MILVVDDKEVNRAILRDIFKKTYEIVEAENGADALAKIAGNEEEIAIILLDIKMPIMDGFEVLTEIDKQGLLNTIPVIMITGDDSRESERKCYEMGVSDIIKKPFDPYIVKRRVDNMIDLYMHKNQLEKMVEEQIAILMDQAIRLKESNNQIIETMSTIVEFRNLECGQHVNRIKAFTKVLADVVSEYCPEYKLTKAGKEIMVSASALHDVGKIVIPDAILLKAGRLTAEEQEVMKSHTTKGCEIISMVNGLEDEEYQRAGYDICRYHHERFDGNGYPDGLKGDEIPISGQIVAIADVYDALVSERVYKAAYTTEKAYEMIIEGECGVFSSKMLECFRIARTEFEQVAKAFK